MVCSIRRYNHLFTALQVPLFALPQIKKTYVKYWDSIGPSGLNPYPDSTVHGAKMGPNWVLSDREGPHVGPMNLAIMVLLVRTEYPGTTVPLAAVILSIKDGSVLASTRKRFNLGAIPQSRYHSIYRYVFYVSYLLDFISRIILTVGGNDIDSLQWNFNRKLNIFIQESPFQSVVWKVAAILFRPQCIDPPLIFLVSRGRLY